MSKYLDSCINEIEGIVLNFCKEKDLKELRIDFKKDEHIVININKNHENHENHLAF